MTTLRRFSRFCTLAGSAALALAVCAQSAPAQLGPSPAPLVSPAASTAPALLPAPNASPSGPPERLPPCRVALAKLITKLDSSENIAGDFFVFALDGPLHGDGTFPDLPVGTRGNGIVSYVDRPGSGGQPGRIIVEPRFLLLPDGSHLQVTVDPQLSQGFAQGKTANLNPLLQFIPGMGLVVNGYNALHNGREVLLPPGTTFRIIVGDGLATGDCYVPRLPDTP